MTELLLHEKTNRDVQGVLKHPRHALLLVGPTGAGKSSLAEHMAKELLSVKSLENHPYIQRIDASEGEGIAHVREIRTFLSLKTTGKDTVRRVLILERVDSLGFDAQNALLKVVEEPPEDTVLLLTAASTGKVADTILSRTTSIKILPLSAKEINGLAGYEAEDLKKAHSLSGGYAGSFKALLDSDSEHEIKQGVALAKKFLSQTVYQRLCDVDAISKDKAQALLLVDGLERCLQAAIKPAKHSSLPALVKKLEYIDKAQTLLASNANTKLLLTALALNM